jgi:hypothetical protein
MKKNEFMENSLRIARATGIGQEEVISKLTVLLKEVRKRPKDVCGICVEEGVIFVATGNASFRVDMRLKSIKRHEGNPAGYSISNNATGHRLPASAPSRRW